MSSILQQKAHVAGRQEVLAESQGLRIMEAEILRSSAELSWSEFVRKCQCIAVQFKDICLDFAAISRGLRILLEQEASSQSL